MFKKNLFSGVTLVDVDQDVLRNIVSLTQSQDLFDDLSEHANEWALAQHVEAEVKPYLYQSTTPIIDRPFEEAQWFNTITWPFENWQASRFSDGSFGVWYGCDSIKTTIFETSYHWYHNLIVDAGFENQPVVGERKLYSVSCQAALLDFRPLIADNPELLHKTDYSAAQSLGARVHHEGHPGLVIPSARYAQGESYAVFNPRVLSNPRFNCQLTYRLNGRYILVEKKPGVTWMKIPLAQ